MARQVEFDDGGITAYLGCTRAPKLDVPDGQNHMGTRTGERPRRRHAHPIGGSG